MKEVVVMNTLTAQQLSGYDIYERLKVELQSLSYVRVFERVSRNRSSKLFWQDSLGKIHPHSLPTLGNELLEVVRSADKWFGAYDPKIQKMFRRDVDRVFRNYKIDLSVGDTEIDLHSRWLNGDSRMCIRILVQLLVSLANYGSLNPSKIPPGHK
jgi:hypothetical protein